MRVGEAACPSGSEPKGCSQFKGYEWGFLRRQVEVPGPPAASDGVDLTDSRGSGSTQFSHTMGARGYGPVHPSPWRLRCAVWCRRGADICRVFDAAIHGQGVPRHLSTHHDPLFEAHRWTANLRILEIDEIKTVPHLPISHPFVERLIGTVRREFLDHVLFWNARDLERKLTEFQTYYNAARGHASLEGHTPLTFASGQTAVLADLNHMRWVSHCRDLVHLPVAA
jgi:hypothetical protein